MHASAKEYSEAHALLSTTSADVALPMCSSTVPTLIDSANDPKTESWCFSLAITGQGTRPIV